VSRRSRRESRRERRRKLGKTLRGHFRLLGDGCITCGMIQSLDLGGMTCSGHPERTFREASV
jgi:hypothetical protein